MKQDLHVSKEWRQQLQKQQQVKYTQQQGKGKVHGQTEHKARIQR